MYCRHNRTLVLCIVQYPDDNTVQGKIDNLLDLMNNYMELIIFSITLVLSMYSFYLVCMVFTDIC